MYSVFCILYLQTRCLQGIERVSRGMEIIFNHHNHTRHTAVYQINVLFEYVVHTHVETDPNLGTFEYPHFFHKKILHEPQNFKLKSFDDDARGCSKCTENQLSKSYCCIVLFRV